MASAGDWSEGWGAWGEGDCVWEVREWLRSVEDGDEARAVVRVLGAAGPENLGVGAEELVALTRRAVGLWAAGAAAEGLVEAGLQSLDMVVHAGDVAAAAHALRGELSTELAAALFAFLAEPRVTRAGESGLDVLRRVSPRAIHLCDVLGALLRADPDPGAREGLEASEAWPRAHPALRAAL